MDDPVEAMEVYAWLRERYAKEIAGVGSAETMGVILLCAIRDGLIRMPVKRGRKAGSKYARNVDPKSRTAKMRDSRFMRRLKTLHARLRALFARPVT